MEEKGFTYKVVYKNLAVYPPSSQSEGPTLGSPIVASREVCHLDDCEGRSFGPVSYQLGRVMPHHYHPRLWAGGIYARSQSTWSGIVLRGRTGSYWSRDGVIGCEYLDCEEFRLICRACGHRTRDFYMFATGYGLCECCLQSSYTRGPYVYHLRECGGEIGFIFE